jgi:uncharacterized protein (UPF0210 family)
MIRSDQILKTVAMIQEQHLDVRAVTLGLNLMDCRSEDVEATCDRIRAKINRCAGQLLPACRAISDEYAVPVVNKRLAVTPIAHVGAGFDRDGFARLGRALDEAAGEVGVDFVGGFSANVESGVGPADLELFAALPETLATTQRVCGSVNVGSTRYGINMDAVRMMGQAVYDLGWRSADRDGFAAAKFVVFTNQPDDNPFMAGAIHGVGQPEMVINVGVSGPGVVARALERLVEERGPEQLGLHDLADEIKRTAFRVTRSGELIGKRVAEVIGAPFGIVDLSLAPTPEPGDSIGEILRILGVDEIGAPGSTAILALLNDAVKKGGAFASASVGGLSGAFIPVSEDAELAAAARSGALTLEKLEAMTSVCSVGLDMIPIPGSVDPETIAALIADEMAIGMINGKTTGARIIPAAGRGVGEWVTLGGLFGEGPVMAVNAAGNTRFLARGGRIPAPLQSLTN